ncbi:MAG: dihydrolipoamide succinyltransferase, partial [Woeseiaceae bacterium]|nr:dihydrolipoamide succinyltransferase [Woeseiaceae bacterium]
MDVLMPQLGETVAEGTIAAWHKQAGDPVEKGEMLVDIETDKVATEITAPASGVLASIKVAEGDTVEVGT